MRALSIVTLLALVYISTPAAAQSSCSARGRECHSRCKQSGVCPKGFCENKVAQCKKDGCFTEGLNNKGGSRCGLNRS